MAKYKCLLIGLFTAMVTAFHVVPASRWTIPKPTLDGRVSSKVFSSRVTTKPLVDWTSANGQGAEAGIQLGGVSIQESKLGGLGLVVTAPKSIPPNTVLVSVPSSVALTVDNSGPNDSALMDLAVRDRKALRNAPWFVQFSLYLLALDKISSAHDSGSKKVELKPWLTSLPRSFDTPIHWSASARNELQYSHLVDSVTRQEKEWSSLYCEMERIANEPLRLNYEQFLWGCECARSRAFSGSFTGSAFQPGIYAFTLFLVTAYVGLGFGTLEQAANGAGLVFCATIFRDFILPKLFQSKKYVICPVIDMANHDSQKQNAEVSFEYFADAYSLASLSSSSSLPTQAALDSGSEVFISYGPRSNDQLLQYYGFVERDNPHDVYIMPPLREWNIAALEEACGVESFSPGRLEKLDRAGLLGSSTVTTDFVTEDSYNVVNAKGGVVLSRAGGIDPAVMQALRALVSTDDEWREAGGAIGNFSVEVNAENERRAIVAARKAIELELSSKPTTLEQDEELLKRKTSSLSKNSSLEDEERLALLFRIEKKKLLHEVLNKL